MLPKICNDGTDLTRVKFYKYGTGENQEKDLSTLGAFPKGEVLRLKVTCPRTLGVTAVVLRLNRDGEGDTDTPFTFRGSCFEDGLDCYELTLPTEHLCGDRPSGLFYYELLFVRGADTLFSNSINNVDFSLSHHTANRFRLLIHEASYCVPSWFGAGVMYHVFVDRFFCGKGETDLQKGRGSRPAILNPDWEHGIPQYPDYPGAPLANNMFFGGNLWGVAEKLDYLESLGVKVIYLSPIFKAYSNHKYDTGDYMTVDPGFGGEPALQNLLRKADAKGIKVILDGVFNHTGDDSIYFNRYGTYTTVGAYQSEDSPYADWYHFRSFPEEFESWWGIPILPKLNSSAKACRTYFTGADGVCAHYVNMGIGGWRLDVADELSDRFLDELRVSVKAASQGEAVIIGEVWENAADKIAYGYRRRYLQGKQLDSVMNYPVRNGILSFVKDGDAPALYHVLTELYASYPRSVSDALMNLLGTHDTRRILTVLGSEPADLERPNHELAHASLSPKQRAKALKLLRMAAALQFTVFGIPSIYYGDEVGMEGYHDPFCRLPFPWKESEGQGALAYRTELLTFYRTLGELRKSPAFHGGDFRVLCHGDHHIVYERISSDAKERYVIAAHRGTGDIVLPLQGEGEIVLSSGNIKYRNGILTLGADSVCIIQ
ncbi:MAG: hypothetical protein E7645_05210 [Ruminococcaceae bacterium]|nr:hypothetical protein [Oscillospiraceae bacterium]